jgi:hypothetical protein
MRLLSAAYEELTRGGIRLENPACPASLDNTQSVGASRRKAGASVSANLDIFWLKHGSLEYSAKRKSEI